MLPAMRMVLEIKGQPPGRSKRKRNPFDPNAQDPNAPPADPNLDPQTDPNVDPNGPAQKRPDPQPDPNAPQPQQPGTNTVPPQPPTDPNPDPNAPDVPPPNQDPYQRAWSGDVDTEGDETDPTVAFAAFAGDNGVQAWLDRSPDGTVTGWVKDSDGTVYRYTDPKAWAVDVDDAAMTQEHGPQTPAQPDMPDTPLIGEAKAAPGPADDLPEITDRSDLGREIKKCAGMSGDQSKLRAHLKARAKAMGASWMIPKGW